MKSFQQRIFLGVLSVALMFCVTLVPTTAAQKRGTKGGAFVPRRANDAARHSNQAAKVVREVMSVPDKAIPRDLIDRAEAVAVCPNVIKAALVVGGQKGDCIISRRTLKRGWGAPVFYNMAGGSFGAQIGGSSTDYVLLFMNDGALKGLMEDKFEIGGEVGAAAGPVGRTASVSTNATLDAGILTYARSKGAFIGAALKGIAITPDNDLNEAFYGKKAREVVASRDETPVPSTVRSLPLQLSRYSSRR